MNILTIRNKFDDWLDGFLYGHSTLNDRNDGGDVYDIQIADGNLTRDSTLKAGFNTPDMAMPDGSLPPEMVNSLNTLSGKGSLDMVDHVRTIGLNEWALHDMGEFDDK